MGKEASDSWSWRNKPINGFVIPLYLIYGTMAVQDTAEDNEEKNWQKQSHFIYNYLTVRGPAMAGWFKHWISWYLGRGPNLGCFVFSNLRDCVSVSCYVMTNDKCIFCVFSCQLCNVRSNNYPGIVLLLIFHIVSLAGLKIEVVQWLVQYSHMAQ